MLTMVCAAAAAAQRIALEIVRPSPCSVEVDAYLTITGEAAMPSMPPRVLPGYHPMQVEGAMPSMPSRAAIEERSTQPLLGLDD